MVWVPELLADDKPSASLNARTQINHLSLEGMHGTVAVPRHDSGFWRQWRAFAGPALLVSVGYMDPGNWCTDLSSGAEYKYRLLWVVGVASLMAMLLQVISARLGVATGKDLAQCCRDWYPRWTRWPNYLLCEIAIGACDLTELLGGAVALNLMFHIPLLGAVIITAADVLLLLALQRCGMRTIEAVVLLLVATISACYFIEIFVLPQTQPNFMEMAHDIDSQQFTFDPGELAYIAAHNIRLDHEGEYTVSAGASYSWKDNKIYVDMLYGSGLRAGFANLQQEPQYYPVNIGYEHVFHLDGLGGNAVKFRVDILNIFDQSYQLRNGSGVGVNASQFGERRAIYAGIAYDF